MIIVDKGKLKFLLAGRQVEVDVPREYRRGRVYAAGVKPKHAICRVLVVDTAESEAGWTLTIRQHTEERPRFLAANPGAIKSDYTFDPNKAARGEFEPLDATTLDRYAAEGLAGHARRKALELRRQHVRSATIRLREAERREDWEAYRRALQDLQAVERLAA